MVNDTVEEISFLASAPTLLVPHSLTPSHSSPLAKSLSLVPFDRRAAFDKICIMKHAWYIS